MVSVHFRGHLAPTQALRGVYSYLYSLVYYASYLKLYSLF